MGTDLSAWITIGQPEAAQCLATCSARSNAVWTSIMIPTLTENRPSSSPVPLGHQPKDLQLPPVYILFRPFAPQLGIVAQVVVIRLVFHARRIVLVSLQLLFGLGSKGIQKLRVQQDAAGLFTAQRVVCLVQPTRQKHMGRADIGIAPVPFDKRDLVERRRLL